ncbi:MAG: hypothetical protein M5R36_10405 [Deltaproteobacteria bacterium]|nr:hypothetical protein [Deltaproteobacteria bacterium]
MLAEHGEPVRSLRDATPEMIERHRDALGETGHKRARHVVTENTRILKAVAALEAGDPDGLGALINETHASLRDDYEVSIPELDAMTGALRAIPAVRGARLVGAGFGGCAIAIAVDAPSEDDLAAASAAYHGAMGRDGIFHVLRPGRGAMMLF